MSIPEAIVSCAREGYPLAYRDVYRKAMDILERLKEKWGWGSLRALRELAGNPGLVEEMRERPGNENSRAGAREKGVEVFADFPRIYTLAQRKRQAGFSLEDCLEMAVRELYPHTFRRTLDAAFEYLHRTAQRLEVHELRALRELAEDPSLLHRLFGEGPHYPGGR